jgi:AraC-like DNA-binding protein
MGGEVSMRTLYLNPAIRAPLPDACRVVQVTPLLRELLLATIRLRSLDRRKPAERHLLEVILDQIAVLPLAPLDLPAPRDKRGLSAAQMVRAHPDRRLRLADVTREAGASPRTLERLFKAETGLSFGAWCQRARMLHALQLLAAGGSVTTTSLKVGYESLSAFVAAFSRTFGTTPGRYFAAEPSAES